MLSFYNRKMDVICGNLFMNSFQKGRPYIHMTTMIITEINSNIKLLL